MTGSGDEIQAEKVGRYRCTATISRWAGVAAEDETRDLIEGVDEDGNNVLLEVVRYFFYNGEEYVVLAKPMMANATVNASIVTTTRKRKPSISIS